MGVANQITLRTLDTIRSWWLQNVCARRSWSVSVRIALGNFGILLCIFPLGLETEFDFSRSTLNRGSL